MKIHFETDESIGGNNSIYITKEELLREYKKDKKHCFFLLNQVMDMLASQICVDCVLDKEGMEWIVSSFKRENVIGVMFAPDEDFQIAISLVIRKENL